ncbi:centromere/kinetochore protein zw10 [Ceratobasidium sp. AG-Ba]|nr:centromere/kinetochore protein zw10 [Ceratobasidium sp. AG-Ba]
MAFVVPQHLPRSAQSTGYGSTTSHAEPVLRKLSDATRESLTSTEASKWVHELQKSIDETKTRVQQRINKDIPSFERHLASAEQIKAGLEEIKNTADDLTSKVQSPQSGLLPTLLTTLATHSTLAQRASDAEILEVAVSYIARCRDEFKELSALVEDGHLPAAVRKADEAQSLVQSAPRPLERSAIMHDLSRLARVLGDRVQEQLGDAYSRGVSVTAFPTGTTVVVLPSVSLRDSKGVVTLSELFGSLKPQSLQEHLAGFRKDILAKAVEPLLKRPSRINLSRRNPGLAPVHNETLTIQHTSESELTPSASFQHAHDSLSHTTELVNFLHLTLFPALPSSSTFTGQLAGPIAQAIISHVLRPAIPRTGSLERVPDFLRLATHASEVEERLNQLGLRSGDVREWAQGAPGHYERRRREDLVQHVREVVLERDNAAVAVKRTITHEHKKSADTGEEDDPWAFEEPASKPTLPDVPVIAAPTPRNLAQPASEATLRVVDQPPRLVTPPTAPPLELPEVDGWGFDDDEPTHTSEDEPDVEVDAGTSQSEGAGTGTSASGSGSGDTSHPTELLSAPHSDAEIVNATQSGEESDPWDDDPWADQPEETAETEKSKAEALVVPPSPAKSPAPTLSPAKQLVPLDPPNLTFVPRIETPPTPALVETPPSPAVHAPSPRVARGLERFAQKNRGTPSPTPSKFSSPIISNASPTVSHVSSSMFGTAPSSALPQSATYGSPTTSYHSPPNPHASLPNIYGSPSKSLASLPAAASIISNKPPTIAPPITPAMRRAQQQAKLASGSRGSDVGSPSSSVAGSPPRKGRGHEPRDSTGSGIRFGVTETYGGNRSVPGSPERRATVLPTAREEPATETYMVSRRAQKVLGLAEDALKEGKELVSTNIFPPNISPTPGSLVLGCIPSFFDLFRALVPVAHGAYMAASGGIAMRFSNDCIYLSDEMDRLISDIPEGTVGNGAKPKFIEAQERLKALGESWFEDVLENEKLAIAKYLEPAEGFRDIQDQARYQECKRAVTRCTQAVTKFSRDTKPVLPLSKYYLALGTLVEDVLSRVIDEIMAMHDIPETESHRLHDICKTVHIFESLFILEDDSTSSVTLHVPSWFKYSYLSELLEASLADIRHLFEMGALVDFSEQDLAHLIRALFSDSPKRQELVDRVLAGHPSQ